jgi:hypothetical protein
MQSTQHRTKYEGCVKYKGGITLNEWSVVKSFPIYDPAFFDKSNQNVFGANCLTMNEVIAACLLRRYQSVNESSVRTHLCAPISMSVDEDCLVTIEYSPKCSVPQTDNVDMLCDTMKVNMEEHIHIALKHLHAMGLTHGDVRTINMGVYDGDVYLFDFDSVAFSGFFPAYTATLGYHSKILRDTYKADHNIPVRTCCYATDSEALEASINFISASMTKNYAGQWILDGFYKEDFLKDYISGKIWDLAFDSDKSVDTGVYIAESWIFEGCVRFNMPRVFDERVVPDMETVTRHNVNKIAKNIFDIASSSDHSNEDVFMCARYIVFCLVFRMQTHGRLEHKTMFECPLKKAAMVHVVRRLMESCVPH